MFGKIKKKHGFYIDFTPQNQSKQLDIVGAVILRLETFQIVRKHVSKKT